MRTLYISERADTRLTEALRQAGHAIHSLHPDEANWAIAESRHQIIVYDTQAAELARFEAEVKQFAQEVEKLKTDLETQAVSQKAQLAEIEATITSAEDSVPVDQREQYRRNVRQRGADALAAVEGGACVGCYTSVTTQMLNELINRDAITFCKSCGRLLYLAEDEAENSRGSGNPKGKAKR